MPEFFSLIDEREEKGERLWTYSVNFDFTFNELEINHFTITDHTWKKKGRDKITRELILDIFKEKLNGSDIEPEPKKNPNWKRDHFVPKRIPYQGKKYKLVFWFKDDTNDHLWVKNCHQQD